MKKRYTLVIASAALLGVTSCDSLDLSPESSITDANFWQTADQFTAFSAGCNTYFRMYSWNMFLFGEPRSDVFDGTPFGGEAQQGMENLYYNTLSLSTPVVSNFGGLYYPINQLNMLIAKSEETTLLDTASKSYYLGMGYGMRAYLYFQLLRTYGEAIIYTDYTSGTTLDLSNLARTQDSESAVLAQIKSDISASESAFANNWAFTKGKNYWSLAATEMLKAEVYLWSGKNEGGGSSDYQTALAAAQSVQTNSGCSLLATYTDVFAFSKKKNDEIIFSLYSGENEYTMLGGSFYSNCMPQQSYLINGSYYNEDHTAFGDTNDKTISGLIRLPLNTKLHDQLYRSGDSRKAANIRDVYMKNDDGTYYYKASFPYKYQGTLLSGATTRAAYDDYPIYRFADCLLLIAEAKAYLGQDPGTEINAVRQRAYGTLYDANTVGYPNDTWATDLVGSDEDPVEAVLKERFRELIFEGRRWYDLRQTGLCLKYSQAESGKLLWPIDQSTLTNNAGLHQTTGY